MTGFIILLIALTATLAAIFSYICAHVHKDSNSPHSGNPFGRIAFAVSAAGIVSAAIFLFSLIFGNHFEYVYVWSYSSRELAAGYKIAAFWAGQEGSFLLWICIHTIFGCYFIRKNRMDSITFAIYLLLQALLLVVLLAKSPFKYMPEVFLDGAGLNPLLQDPWMAVHPPIIFLGYALLAIPFCYAAGSLLNKRCKTWIAPALRWVLPAWTALGAGIFIGGYWAYKVLGWGGYWTWDPVENASLVPWLLGAALLHLLLVAKRKESFLRSAYLVTFFTFSAVLYGTFLTRSGILSDFSVHSFGDGGIGDLLAMIAAGIWLFSLLLLTLRWSKLPQAERLQSLPRRQQALIGGVILFCLLAFLVFIGMSMPLITSLLSSPQNVDTVFYEKTTLPLAVVMMLLLGAGILRHYGCLAISAFLGVYLAYSYQLWQPLYVFLFVFAMTAVFSNLLWMQREKFWGAGIAHIGAALLFIGVLLSSAGARSVQENFLPQEEKNIYGHSIVYQGQLSDKNNNMIYEVFEIDGTKTCTVTKLRPDGTPAAREPAIYHQISGDLYLAPLSRPEAALCRTLILDSGKSTAVDNLSFCFHTVEIQGQNSDMEGMSISVPITAAEGTRIESCQLVLTYDQGFEATPAYVFDGAYKLSLTGVSEDKKRIRIEIVKQASAGKLRQIETELSWKPGVGLVWLGAAAITVGSLGAAIQRFRH